MMKPIDDEGRGAKLESIKHLLDSFKKSSLEKLPKKGVSVMSLSVSKPKGEEQPEESEESSLESKGSLSEHLSEEPQSEEMEEGIPEEENLREPGIPSELMELVKMLMSQKSKKEEE